MEVKVQGAEQLAALSRRLRETGSKDLRREVFRGLGRAAKPAKAAAKREALRRLPKRGGLAELVASSRIGSRNRLAGNDPSVRIVATNRQTRNRG